jgi:ferredoxin
MRVIIDKSICTGHGRCYSLVPSVFEADDAGNGMVIDEDVSEDLRPQALIAVQNCPERAISIAD